MSLTCGLDGGFVDPRLLEGVEGVCLTIFGVFLRQNQGQGYMRTGTGISAARVFFNSDGSWGL